MAIAYVLHVDPFALLSLENEMRVNVANVIVAHRVVLAAAVRIDCCVEPLAPKVTAGDVLVSEATFRGALDVRRVVSRTQLEGVLQLHLAENLGVCFWNYEIPH